MTEEEIKKIVRDYINCALPVFAYPSAQIRDDFATDTREKAIEFLQWLSKDYAIVPKSVIDKLSIAYRAKAYNLVCLNKEDVENLFGSEMFEEDKE